MSNDHVKYLFAESGDGLGLGIAKEASEVLGVAYPAHTWVVRCDGGVLFIRCASVSAKIGMVRHLSDIMHDAEFRKRDIIRAAGELLERANLSRRGITEYARVLDGGEQFKFKPPEIEAAHGGLILPEKK